VNEARAQQWEAGAVAHWYLRPSQLDVYDKILETKFPFIEAARRFGKTNSVLAFVLEQLRQNPGWICRWCFPNKNQAREVLGAEIPKLQKDCPDALRFQYQTTDSVYIGPNGSKLYIRGVNEDRGDSARGPASNIIVCDEYGFWNEPDYIVREALFPQLENQPGQWLIKASTPPRNLGHRYYTEREEAIRKDRFIQKIIYDNEALSQEELQIIIEESGGADSPAFRRERLCEPVSDPELLIIPEWDDKENTVPDDYPRPEFFTPYVGGDSGADDNTAVLFGWYDFQRNEVVIDQEMVIAGQTTSTIVHRAKAIEKELWGEVKPRRRVYDAPKQLIYDIFVDHKWPVMMPQKDDKVAAIHGLRVEVGARRFKVKERCKHTRRQLKVGMWRDEKHLDFERTEGLGHLDAIAAAVYFNRHVDRKLNPIPANFGLHRETHFIPARVSQGQPDPALAGLPRKVRKFK
jgi:Terminase large subunit, T4likevirus-type, N-terminal